MNTDMREETNNYIAVDNEKDDPIQQNKEESLLLPVCFCLDASASMNALTGDFVPTGETVFLDGRSWNVAKGGTRRIKELQRGLEAFIEGVAGAMPENISVEVSVVTFGEDVKTLLPLQGVGEITDVPTLVAKGGTLMGEGVNMALDILEERLDAEEGAACLKPWLVLVSDGSPNGDLLEFHRAMGRSLQLVGEDKLEVFPVGMTVDSNLFALGCFSPKRSVLRIQEGKAPEFFSWLATEISMVTAGEVSFPSLKMSGIEDWAEF